MHNQKQTQQLSYTKCSMQDSECLTSEGQKFVRTFVNGIPESHVEKLDEMFIETIEINTDAVDHELQNVKITGLKDAKINDISFDNNFKLMRVSFDANLTTNSEYTLDGVLFRQPISGTGTTTYHIKNIQVDMLILYDIIETENGKHRMKVRRYRSGFTVKTGVDYEYRNLFNGDKKKNEAVHDILNKNWVTITSLFGNKFYYKIFDNIFDAIKAFTRSYDLEDLFLYP
ncbi:circadian clock-controlled protein daywake-like [Melitaea cinxia]|uniref:circadian clock-controlled protein daywake-like n=1 Tax=Melitaea cinxia TaxID=113334 RepID=UPI001E270362|nr:circadian clock-controlled protein daywake-like [Melitaea cinxia]